MSITIEKIWLSDDAVCIRTAAGDEARELFADYPRLRYATAAERADYTVDAHGIHWNTIGEDLSFEGFFEEKHQGVLYRLFIGHPELNASAVARRLNIPQTLFAQYLSGAAEPTAEHRRAIIGAVRSIGRELMAEEC